MLDPKVVLALSNMAQCFGEAVGALEGIASAHPDADTRERIHSHIGLLTELDPVARLVDALVGQEPSDKVLAE